MLTINLIHYNVSYVCLILVITYFWACTGARLAQLVEYETLNLRVMGSGPTLGVCFLCVTILASWLAVKELNTNGMDGWITFIQLHGARCDSEFSKQDATCKNLYNLNYSSNLFQCYILYTISHSFLLVL